ncbi:hypothetical protein DFH09DRAFT_1360902 [Mycena vulgaris]|nr:hypothetical protein DFH09DRAFT_1360902 [Mycena vulgaris]
MNIARLHPSIHSHDNAYSPNAYKGRREYGGENHQLSMKLFATLVLLIAPALALALPAITPAGANHLRSMTDEERRNCGLPCTCPDLSCFGPDP